MTTTTAGAPARATSEKETTMDGDTKFTTEEKARALEAAGPCPDCGGVMEFIVRLQGGPDKPPWMACLRPGCSDALIQRMWPSRAVCG